MAQFSFGFSGDDIEIDNDDVAQTSHHSAQEPLSEEENAPALPPQTHSVEELLSTLPSKISYSFLTVTSPNGRTIRLPRRELFDIRMQLMAEDDNLSDDNPMLSAGLNDTDIKTNIYEGGFKSWECSIDLVKLLLDRGPRKDLDDMARVDHVIELGCGTALPTLTLFHYALTNAHPLTITLSDYNPPVLRLVTLPNLLLTFCATLPSSSPFLPEDFHTEATGDLAITPELISAFLGALSTTPIHLTLLSGTWAPKDVFLPFVPHAPGGLRTLVLASETIYSPAALQGFTDALLGILQRAREGKAIVAAKRVYFGVGGGLDAFMDLCSQGGAVVSNVQGWDGDLGEGGVRRGLVEVQMAS